MTWDLRETGVWWESVSKNGRIAWMMAAGFTPETAYFAAFIPWKNLPALAQVKLVKTELPVDYDGENRQVRPAPRSKEG